MRLLLLRKIQERAYRELPWFVAILRWDAHKSCCWQMGTLVGRECSKLPAYFRGYRQARDGQEPSLRGEDIASLDVEALLVGLSHAEGLAWERADGVDRLQEARLVKLRQQQADRMTGLHRLVHRLLA